MWVSPVFTAVERVAFACGGVSLATARAASVVMGLAGVLLLIALDPRRRSGWVAAFLVAISFAGAQLGRLALPETTGTTLGLAGAVGAGARRAARRGARGHLRRARGARETSLRHARARARARRIRARAPARRARAAPRRFLVMASAAAPLVLWGAWAAAHAADVAPLLHFYGTDRWFARPSELVHALVGAAKPALQVLISGVVYRHALIAHFGFALVLAALAIPAIVAGVWRREREIPDAVVVMTAWVLVAGAAIAALPFQPLRYWAPLVPALVYVGVWAVMERGAVLATARGRIFHIGAWIAGFLVAAQIASHSLVHF